MQRVNMGGVRLGSSPGWLSEVCGNSQSTSFQSLMLGWKDPEFFPLNLWSPASLQSLARVWASPNRCLRHR